MTNSTNDGKHWQCTDCKEIVQSNDKPQSCDCGGNTFRWAYTIETVYSGSLSGFTDSVYRMFDNTTDDDKDILP